MSAHDPHFDDEQESEDDFNPAPANDSEDDEPSPRANKQSSRRDRGSDDENADSEGDADGSRTNGTGRASRKDDDEGDDDEDEDGGGDRRGDDEDEEDEEDEDEDDVQGAHQRKRRKRDRRAQFFDIEAEVEDEDEAEDEEKDGEEIEDFIDNEHPDDVVETGRLDDDRRHRELDRRREMEQNIDAEKQAAILKERYAKRRPARGLNDAASTPRRLLLPGVEDPKIWAVRCREGKEREAVNSINKRIGERRGTKNEMAITCAFERAGTNSVMKGYIYVEAFKLPDILANIDGVMNVYPRSKCMMIDIKEMPDLLRVIQTPTLSPGSWVRLKRPFKHNGDLAQVMNVTENGLEARVRWIPRIDYSEKKDQNLAVTTADGKRKRTAGAMQKPPQRLFNEVEARKRDPRAFSSNLQGAMQYFRNEEFEHGYQVKDIKIHLLQTTDVNPTLEEVTKFATRNEDGTESLDLKSLAASLKDGNSNVAYLPGDVVEVYEGEQRGVIGKATNVQGDIVTMQVTEGVLVGQTIEVPVKGLRKRFRAGDHAKVIGGQFRDEVGMVVKIDKDKVTLLTDQNHTEVTVFSSHLREASDIGGQGSLGQYSLLDLVQLDATTVGCIVKVDRESFVVLDQNGDTRQVMPSQISNRLPKRKTAVAADRDGSEIRLDDVVREHGGQQRQGKILHIHRSFLFMHNNTTNENAGVFVTRSSNVKTVAAKGGRINALSSGPDLDAMNPALKRNPGGNSQMAAPQKVFGRDRALGHTVTIRRGGYKGLLGVVKDTTDSHARIELHTKGKIITVAKSDLIFKDKITGRTIDINTRGGMSGGRGGGYAGGSTGRGGSDRGSAPAWENGGSRTPQISSGDSGSRTPAWGARSSAMSHTPAWSRSDMAGSRTPAWGAAEGSRTVNPYSGSRTAYGGSGSRTPAWSAGAKTPAHDGFSMGSKTPAYGGSGGSDSWGAGSKTPAYASAPTPAANNDSWGQTPGASGSSAFDAPTPGAGLSAPTPGALSAPTPGAYSAPTPAPFNAPTPGGGWQGGGWGADSAPTPAVGAPTPGAYYSAPTPAAYGGAAETPAASGPRYAEDDDD